VLCAYVALYSYHRPEDVMVYGDFKSGYIVTPTLPAGSVADRKKSRSSLENRLIRAMELLEDAQRELTAIREALR
jgi:predicted RNase H-like nuclease